MIDLTNYSSTTTEKLQMFLSGAAATTNPKVTITSYIIRPVAVVDYGESMTFNEITTLAGATETDVASAPDSGTIKRITKINIYNADTAEITLTCCIDKNGTNHIQFKRTLSAGETLLMTDSLNESINGDDDITRKVVTPEDYGAVGDGTTDDATALAGFWNAIKNDTKLIGHMPDKTYVTTAVLPTVSAPGFTVIGSGLDLRHSTGTTTPRNGTHIKYTGSTSGSPVLAKFEPVSGASEDALIGVNVVGVTFDANNLAAKAVTIKSCRYCNFEIGVWDGTTCGLELGALTNANLGDPTSATHNRMVLVGVQETAASGKSIVMSGDADGNWSLNWFERVDIFHKDAVGISCENVDNNLWGKVRIFRSGAGSATNSIEWLGSNSAAATVARAERFLDLTTTVAAIAKGTSSYTYPAHSIRIDYLDQDNGTPVPTEETGATIFHPYWRTFATTITSGTGTLTSASATMAYRRWAKQSMEVNGSMTITTNGTGASYLNLTLPYAAAGTSSSIVSGKGSTGTGVTITGIAASGGTNLSFQDYAGVYPAADGYVFQYNGTIRLAANGA